MMCCQQCDAYMCMGADGAWDGMGVNGTLEGEPLISDLLRGLVETGRWTTASCRNPGTEALDLAEETK